MQRVVELAAHHFYINTIACTIQRAVGKDIQAGVVDFAFVEKFSETKRRLQHLYPECMNVPAIYVVTARYRCHRSHRGSSRQDRQSTRSLIPASLHPVFTRGPHRSSLPDTLLSATVSETNTTVVARYPPTIASTRYSPALVCREEYRCYPAAAR